MLLLFKAFSRKDLDLLKQQIEVGVITKNGEQVPGFHLHVLSEYRWTFLKAQQHLTVVWGDWSLTLWACSKWNQMCSINCKLWMTYCFGYSWIKPKSEPKLISSVSVNPDSNVRYITRSKESCAAEKKRFQSTNHWKEASVINWSMSWQLKLRRKLFSGVRRAVYFIWHTQSISVGEGVLLSGGSRGSVLELFKSRNEFCKYLHIVSASASYSLKFHQSTATWAT